MVSYELQIKMNTTHIPFYIQQLRKSSFQDPVTDEQECYNMFLDNLIRELDDYAPNSFDQDDDSDEIKKELEKLNERITKLEEEESE